MLKAQGYTPTIIWVKAGADIAKHCAVILTDEALVFPAQDTGSQAIGFTLKPVEVDEYVAVQTEGVIYEWEGSPSDLGTSAVYYQGPDGTLLDSPTGSGDPLVVGFAVDSTTLHIRIGSSGGIASGSVKMVTHYLNVTADQIVAKVIPLPDGVKKGQVEDLILYGGDIHLVESVDFVIEDQEHDDSTVNILDGNNDTGGVVDAIYPSTDVISGTPGISGGTVTQASIVWQAAKLDPASISILERLKPGDLITVKQVIRT